MIKELFLKQFPKEMEYEVSKLYNLWEISKEYGVITYSEEFYTPNIWKKMSYKMEKIYVKTNGVFENSDRRQIAFVPEEYEKEEIEFPNKLVKIIVNSKFKELKHKDFLGSLMGLNIKRELMGDLILENGTGYIPISEKIINVVLMELKQIGKSSCEIEILEENQGKIPTYQYENKMITVASKRLDGIVAEITKLSRSKVVESIEKGHILVDYEVIRNKSKNIEIGSVITVRGFGKYKIFEELGVSKKNKEKIVVKKYI